MRATTVASAKKDQGACESCHEPVLKGQGYRWVKSFRGPKRVRHLDCPTWRASELVNDKLAAALAAQEDASDALLLVVDPTSEADAQRFADEVKSVLNDVDASDSIDECQEAYDNLPENFQQSETGERFEEWRDTIESWQDSCQSFEPDAFEYEHPEGEATETLEVALEVWAEDVRQAAQDIIDELEVG